MSSSKTEDRILRHTGEGDALCHHPTEDRILRHTKMATGYDVIQDGYRM